jgi:hypothetical protein
LSPFPASLQTVGALREVRATVTAWNPLVTELIAFEISTRIRSPDGVFARRFASRLLAADTDWSRIPVPHLRAPVRR